MRQIGNSTQSADSGRRGAQEIETQARVRKGRWHARLPHRKSDQSKQQEEKALADRQRHARHQHSEQQKADRSEFRHRFLQESRRIKIERAANRPKGLAEFLGRITGVALITQKVQQFRDATRYRAFLAQKKEMAERQQREAAAFERKLALETLTVQRRLRALELVEQRERKSLEIALLKERRVEERERTERQPEPEPTRDPSGRIQQGGQEADRPESGIRAGVRISRGRGRGGRGRGSGAGA